MYKVALTNFGKTIYEGDDYTAAQAVAVATGFECTMTYPNAMWSWSPIGGWRTIYNENR